MTTAASPEAPSPPSGYPVRLTIERPDKQSRLTNFPLFIGTFIRYVLLIPHLFLLAFFGVLASLVYFLATFAILFTGRYPRGMYDLVAGYMRWSTCVNGYLYHLFDKYPQFSGTPTDYPATLDFDYPEKSSRLLNFPFFGIIIRFFLLIPHYLVVWLLGLIAFLVMFLAQFAILFTGAFPGGMHGFVAGVLRWSTRLNAYMQGLTDRYPPFSLR
jgi:hypothetical protein